MNAAPALWIRWRRDGRPRWSVAHHAAVSTALVAGGLYRLSCGRTAPEGMAAQLEVTAAGWTAVPCRQCVLGSMIGGRLSPVGPIAE